MINRFGNGDMVSFKLSNQRQWTGIIVDTKPGSYDIMVELGSGCYVFKSILEKYILDRVALVLQSDKFNETMNELGWNDGNLPEDSAIISIENVDLPEYGQGYCHWGHEPHASVGRVAFNNTTDSQDPRGFSNEQAKMLGKFIEDNIGKHFYIKDPGDGASRGLAIVSFIQKTWPEYSYRSNVNSLSGVSNQFVLEKLLKWKTL